jgi:hypothetical protein
MTTEELREMIAELTRSQAETDRHEDLQRRVFDHGIYLARIHDDLFELQVPEGFEPRSFQTPSVSPEDLETGEEPPGK